MAWLEDAAFFHHCTERSFKQISLPRTGISVAKVERMKLNYVLLKRCLPGAILILLAFLLWQCNGPFPSAQKQGLPGDHTVSIQGVFHKPGYMNPYREASGCSSGDCHQDDLDGGVAVVEGKTTIAPSCFQCHGTKWQDD
jgi:hypothetical protein